MSSVGRNSEALAGRWYQKGWGWNGLVLAMEPIEVPTLGGLDKANGSMDGDYLRLLAIWRFLASYSGVRRVKSFSGSPTTHHLSLEDWERPTSQIKDAKVRCGSAVFQLRSDLEDDTR